METKYFLMRPDRDIFTFTNFDHNKNHDKLKVISPYTINNWNNKPLPFKELDFKLYENEEIPLLDILDPRYLSRGIIISNKVLEIIKEFNVDDHQIFDLEIMHGRKKVKGYSFLFFVSDATHYLDFNRAEFYDDYDDKKYMFNLNSFKKFKKENWLVDFKIKNIFFKKKYDLFLFYRYKRSYPFVSQKLKDAIEESDAVGIEFNEVDINFDLK